MSYCINYCQMSIMFIQRHNETETADLKQIMFIKPQMRKYLLFVSNQQLNVTEKLKRVRRRILQLHIINALLNILDSVTQLRDIDLLKRNQKIKSKERMALLAWQRKDC